MTRLLERALSQVEKLPASEQDAVAAVVIEDPASERRWSESFAKSEDVLAALGEKALAEHAGGQTKLLLAMDRSVLDRPRASASARRCAGHPGDCS